MKTRLLKYFLVSCLLCSWAKVSLAQEYYDGTNTPRQYYYNNFEASTAVAGNATTLLPAAGSTWNSSTKTIDLVSSSSLNSSKSLATTGTSGIGYIKWNFMSSSGSAAGLSMSGATYEWEFDYKNVTGAATGDPDVLLTSATSANDWWRYYLIANTYTTPSNAGGYSGNTFYTTGLYLTQVGGNLLLRYKYGTAYNQVTTYASISMPNSSSTTYQIRVVKSVIGYYNIYILNRTSLATTSSLNINVGVDNGNLGSYNFSYLESSAASATRFEWDNFNFYQQKVDYVPITSAANGISTSVYPGQTNVIPYGVNVNIRGDVIFGTLVFNSTNNAQALFTGGALYKTNNSVLSVSTGMSLVSGVAINTSNTSQMTLPSSEYYYSPGNTSGTTANVINYFLVAQARNPFYGGYPTSLAFSVSTAASDNYQSFYTSGYFPISGSSTTGPTIVASSFYDWNGSQTGGLWSNASNWTPNTVPGTNDIARIGTNISYVYQPNFNTASGGSVGQIQIGTQYAPNTLGAYAATLTVTTPLTVNGNITIPSNFSTSVSNTVTLAGTSTIGVSGNVVFGDGTTPNAAATASAYNLNYTSTGTMTVSGSLSLTPITSGLDVFSPTFNQSAGIFNVMGIGTSNPAGTTSTVKVTGGTLQLTGSTPLSGLSSTGTSIMSFNNTGATVEYSGTAQTVYNSTTTNASGGVSYYNLTLSGSGTKTVGTASYSNLNVSNNFTLAPTAAMTVDLLTYNDVSNITNFTSNALSTLNQGSGQNFTVTGTASNGGIINMLGNSSCVFSGSSGLTNTGTINGLSTYLSQQNLFVQNGTLTNSGTINWYGQSAGPYQSAILTAAITNTGTINLATGTYNGYLYASGLITNSNIINMNNNGAITATAGITSSAYINQSSGTISVSGAALINSGYITKTGGALTTSAGFTNNATGKFIGSTSTGSTTTVSAGAYSNSGTFTCNAETVTYDGAYTNNSGGVFTAGTGMVNFSGGSAQTLTDNSTAGTLFNNVTFNGGNTATMASGTGNFGVSATGILTMAGTNTTLVAGATASGGTGYLTLMSGSTGSAAVGIIPSGCSITGNVNVQRYITGTSTSTNRGYRMLSAPVNVTSPTSALTNYISLNTLDKNASFGGVTYNGAFTGGPGSTATSGFEYQLSNSNSTIYLYDERKNASDASFTSGKHVGVTAIGATALTVLGEYNVSGTTSVSVPAGNGYLLYFVGPNTRSNGSSGTLPADAVITNTGFINQQGVTVNLWYTPANNASLAGTAGNLSYYSTGTTPGYNMVGNPYPCALNLSQVVADNGGSSTLLNIYLLQRNSSPSQAYVAYTPAGTSAPNIGYALSGEGFIVKVAAGGKTLKFLETEKSSGTVLTGSNSDLSIRPTPKQSINSLSGPIKTSVDAIQTPTSSPLTGFYMKLEKDSTTYNYCGIYYSKDWSDKLEPLDALDLSPKTGLEVYLSSLTSDGSPVSVNHMSDYTKGVRTKLFLNAASDGLYHLKIEDIRNIDTTLYSIFLIDNYKKDSLDIGHYGAYAFNVLNADTNSFGGGRFVIAIAQKPVPPYELASFTGQKVSSGVQLNWKTYNEGDYTGFVLQKETTGGQYIQLDSLQSNSASLYSYVDTHPVTGNNIYRLLQDGINGNITYSAPITINYSSLTAGGVFTVYPNPAKELVTFSINSSSSTTPNNYIANIYNTAGELMGRRTVNSSSWTQDVTSYKPGTYIIQLKASTGDTVGQSKFVKTN